MLAVAMVCGNSACDAEPRRARESPDAARHVLDAAASCVHDGAIDALERLSECAVRCNEVPDVKVIQATVEPLSRSVLPGGTGALVLRIKNVGATPQPLCFRTESSIATGWERLSGVSPPKPDQGCERPRIPWLTRTLDYRDASVDELKLGTQVLCARSLRVVLMPGRSLTKTVAWTALRLPAAPRPFEDDAGNRYYPKAVPLPLGKGTYRVELEVPYVDAPPEQRRFAASIDVAPAPEADAAGEVR
ncbi:MAG: hypothetical protein IPG50_26420 [Myxococcales bacterium]|nr:hypothetical protein [Myxococcales bacterium]